MTPRKASLRVAHEAHCPNATKTALESAARRITVLEDGRKVGGCKCSPSYYTFQRGLDGRPKKGRRVKDRRVAERALMKAQVGIDEGRVGVNHAKTISFVAWADEFERITETRVRKGDLKSRTLEGYRDTLTVARATIGHVPDLRMIGPSELRRFDDHQEGQKPASRLSQLRQLSACFAAAVGDGYLDRNPVPAFIKSLRLKSPKRGKAPFEDAELERLLAAYRLYEPVYAFVSRFSVETGARLGEIVALDWTGVDLGNGRVEILHHWDPEDGLVLPKDGETRTVHLTAEAKAVLEEWIGVVGVRTDGPVFENPIGGGRLSARQVQRRLDSAMIDAGIPKLHPELRLPRSFHSFRYTTSVLMQRRGYHPRLIESNLGHGSLELTYGVYGGWTPDQLAAEAARTPGAGR
jgi:integrase